MVGQGRYDRKMDNIRNLDNRHVYWLGIHVFPWDRECSRISPIINCDQVKWSEVTNCNNIERYPSSANISGSGQCPGPVDTDKPSKEELSKRTGENGNCDCDVSWGWLVDGQYFAWILSCHQDTLGCLEVASKYGSLWWQAGVSILCVWSAPTPLLKPRIYNKYRPHLPASVYCYKQLW